MGNITFKDEEKQERLGAHLSELTTRKRSLTIYLDGKTVEAIDALRGHFKNNLIPEPSIGAVARYLIERGITAMQQEAAE